MSRADRANPAPRAAAAAFTLLELILVLVIVATLLTLSTVSLRGLHASQTTRGAAEHFMSVCQQAQRRAITEARPYRLTLDLDARTYQLSREGDQGHEPLSTELGRRFEIDERFTLTYEGASAENSVVELDFFPDGRSQPFRLTFDTPSERAVVVRPAVSEPLHLE